jgi:hypothetical protein
VDRLGGRRAVPRSGEHGAAPRVAQLPVRDGAWPFAASTARLEGTDGVDVMQVRSWWRPVAVAACCCYAAATAWLVDGLRALWPRRPWIGRRQRATRALWRRKEGAG